MRFHHRRNNQWWKHGDPGAVTAEFAVVLPAVVVVALVLLGLGRGVIANVECADAARAAARQITTSTDADGGIAAARTAAVAVSAGSTAAFTETTDSVTVSVTCPLLSGPLGIIPASVSATAVALKQGEN